MANSTGNQYPQMLLYQPFAEYAASPMTGGLHNQQHHLQYDRHPMYMSSGISNSTNNQVRYINRAAMFNSQNPGISIKHQGGFIEAVHNPVFSLAGYITAHGARVAAIGTGPNPASDVSTCANPAFDVSTCANPSFDASTCINPAPDSSRCMSIPSTSHCIDFPILITKQNKLSNENDGSEEMQDAEIGSTCRDFLNQSKAIQHQITSQTNASTHLSVKHENSTEVDASILHKMVIKQHCKQEDASSVKQKSAKNRKGAAAISASPKHHLLLSAINSTSSKDRHTKVATARGLRDRRVRLSPACALQLFDIQDKLGFDQPSKAVDWLLKKAKFAIDRLQVNCNQESHVNGENDFSDEHLQEELKNNKQGISTQICVSPTQSSTEDASETTTRHSDAADHGQLRISQTSDHLENSVSLSLATNEDHFHCHHEQQKQSMLCSHGHGHGHAHRHVPVANRMPKSQKKKTMNSNHTENSNSDRALFSLVL